MTNPRAIPAQPVDMILHLHALLKTLCPRPPSLHHPNKCCKMASFAENASKLHHALASHDRSGIMAYLADEAVLHQGDKCC